MNDNMTTRLLGLQVRGSKSDFPRSATTRSQLDLNLALPLAEAEGEMVTGIKLQALQGSAFWFCSQMYLKQLE